MHQLENNQNNLIEYMYIPNIFIRNKTYILGLIFLMPGIIYAYTYTKNRTKELRNTKTPIRTFRRTKKIFRNLVIHLVIQQEFFFTCGMLRNVFFVLRFIVYAYIYAYIIPGIRKIRPKIYVLLRMNISVLNVPEKKHLYLRKCAY